MRFYKFIFLVSWVFCQSGYEVADMMASREAPSDIKSTLVMILKDKRGNSLESILISHSKDGGKKQIIWFVSPPKDKGISLYKYFTQTFQYIPLVLSTISIFLIFGFYSSFILHSQHCDISSSIPPD